MLSEILRELRLLFLTGDPKSPMLPEKREYLDWGLQTSTHIAEQLERRVSSQITPLNQEHLEDPTVTLFPLVNVEASPEEQEESDHAE
ncbi:hypothetical protein [Flexibacterium corallicola]|uniref:hypothetical protein n=1 Tax=Flexibacterium corallicola TaxID=3037259 RepID=UPI00286F6620|nr:hypothetical protein [Pseudovibrio sp. M1P-2-3]